MESAGGSGTGVSASRAGSAAGSPQQQVFPPQQGPYVPSFVPPTSPPFPGSAGPTTIGFDPNFQAMMLEMMRQNSRLIELMDRRLSAEEKRREEEEAERLRMFHLLDRLMIHSGPVE